MAYQVYKAVGKYTAFSYYGYCPGASDPLVEFLKQANNLETRPGMSQRGAYRMLKDNNDDMQSIEVEVIELAEGEVDAWILRNDARSQDNTSITGPTHWPANFFKHVETTDPGKVVQWRSAMTIRNCATAYEAYTKHKAYSFKQVKALGSQHGDQFIMEQLRSLSPSEFAAKYQVTIIYDKVAKAA